MPAFAPLAPPAWKQFARQHHLGLVGLAFASDEAFLNDGGRGYYYASKGSGQALLEGIRKIYDADLPLLLYGFSGGAHFTSRFTEWKPERVLAWCAAGASWWDKPQKTSVSPPGITPPGIVACGEEDYGYGAALIYFKQGRAAGKPWLWVSQGGIGHARSPALETFVRHYFAAVLSQHHPSSTMRSIKAPRAHPPPPHNPARPLPSPFHPKVSGSTSTSKTL